MGNGESRQHGKGVYKYQNRRWTYYGAPGARKICVSRYEKPAIVDDLNHLCIYSNRRWEKVGENVSAISSSQNNTQIWAVVNDHLKYFNNNNWYKTSASPKAIKELSVARNGDIYAINNLNYLFELFSTTWNSTGSLRGISISANSNSTLYLSHGKYENSQCQKKKFLDNGKIFHLMQKR